MSPRITIPSPSRSTLDLFSALERALAAFTEARKRREAAEKAVSEAKFKRKMIVERWDEPGVSKSVRAEAEHEMALRDAQAAIDDGLARYISAQKQIEAHAVEVERASKALGKAARAELEPVREKFAKAVEASAAETMALLHLAAALNTILGGGRFDAIARIEHPDGSGDLAYKNKPDLSDAVREWARYRALRSSAETAVRELPLNREAAE